MKNLISWAIFAVVGLTACASEDVAPIDPSLILGRWGLDQMESSGAVFTDISGLTHPTEEGHWGWVELRPDGTLFGTTPSNDFSGYYTFDGVNFWGSDVWFTLTLSSVPGVPIELITEAERLASLPFADDRFSVEFSQDGDTMRFENDDYSFLFVRIGIPD